MINIQLPDEIARRLEIVARLENRSVEEVVASMVEQYTPQPYSQAESDAAFEAIFGIFDDDVTDMSTTVRETLHKYFQEKYGDSD
jgi:hypothetical protein